MAVIGGSIDSVSIDGREFSVAADAESQRKLGGWENEVVAFGNGDAGIIKTRVPLMISGLTLNVDDSRGDHEFLQDRADSKDFFALSITYASGVTYQGKAQITGEMQVGSNNSTAAVSFGGPGKLTKQ